MNIFSSMGQPFRFIGTCTLLTRSLFEKFISVYFERQNVFVIEILKLRRNVSSSASQWLPTRRSLKFLCETRALRNPITQRIDQTFHDKHWNVQKLAHMSTNSSPIVRNNNEKYSNQRQSVQTFFPRNQVSVNWRTSSSICYIIRPITRWNYGFASYRSNTSMIRRTRIRHPSHISVYLERRGNRFVRISGLIRNVWNMQIRSETRRRAFSRSHVCNGRIRPTNAAEEMIYFTFAQPLFIVTRDSWWIYNRRLPAISFPGTNVPSSDLLTRRT